MVEIVILVESYGVLFCVDDDFFIWYMMYFMVVDEVGNWVVLI